MRMPLRHPHPGSRVLRKTNPPPCKKNPKEIGKVVGGVSRDRRGGEDEDDEENSTSRPADNRPVIDC
jgi:hypothetical protein